MTRERWAFELRYIRSGAPWDTGITPPEVTELVEEEQVTPGRVLDLGCGTGTNAIYMARHGWDAVGVDFSTLAVLQARWKARRAGLRCRFHRSGVTDMPFLTQPFDLVLDIGCLHSIPRAERTHYAGEVRRLVVPSGRYMLYAFLPRGARSTRGISPDEIVDLFGPDFAITRQEGGDDPTGPSSAWYWLEKVAG